MIEISDKPGEEEPEPSFKVNAIFFNCSIGNFFSSLPMSTQVQDQVVSSKTWIKPQNMYNFSSFEPWPDLYACSSLQICMEMNR